MADQENRENTVQEASAQEKDGKYKVQTPGGEGFIQVADDVVTAIAGLAVTEVDGVACLTGGITREVIAKLGKKNLARGIRVTYEEEGLRVDVSMEIRFGYNIVEVSKNIQEKVKSTLQTMTGLNCAVVNVRISGIDFEDEKA